MADASRTAQALDKLSERLAFAMESTDAAKAFLEESLAAGEVSSGAVFLTVPESGQIVAHPAEIGAVSSLVPREKLEEIIAGAKPRRLRVQSQPATATIFPLCYKDLGWGCLILHGSFQKVKQKTLTEMSGEYARYLYRTHPKSGAEGNSRQSTRSLIHDFKNIAGGLSGYAQLLNRFNNQLSTTEIAQYAEIIQRECERLSRMAEDHLRDLSGECGSGIEACDPGKIIKEVNGLMAADLKNKEIRLLLRIEARRRIKVQTDLLERALVNLIVNARDVLTEGGIIELAAEDSGEEIAFRVSDNGPGISPEVASKIFQSGATFGKENGHGLGLWIVKEIVDLFHGSVSIEKSTFGGTSVVLRLPAH